MNFRRAIHAGYLGCLIAAIFAVWNLSLVGRYQLHAIDSGRAWRIDTKTGDLSFCGNAGGEGPLCFRWSSYRRIQATRQENVR